MMTSADLLTIAPPRAWRHRPACNDVTDHVTERSSARNAETKIPTNQRTDSDADESLDDRVAKIHDDVTQSPKYSHTTSDSRIVDIYSWLELLIWYRELLTFTTLTLCIAYVYTTKPSQRDEDGSLRTVATYWLS